MNNEVINLILESNLLNFTVVAIAIVYLGSKFLPQLAKKRKQELETEIESAKQAKESAEQKLIELKAEIEKAKQESIEIVNSAKETSENIKDKILVEAKQEIERLNKNAEKEIEFQKSLVLDNIKAQIASITLKQIEEGIKKKQLEIDKAVQLRLKTDLQKI